MNNRVLISTEELSVLCIAGTDGLLKNQSDNGYFVMKNISEYIQDLKTYAASAFYSKLINKYHKFPGNTNDLNNCEQHEWQYCMDLVEADLNGKYR